MTAKNTYFMYKYAKVFFLNTVIYILTKEHSSKQYRLIAILFRVTVVVTQSLVSDETEFSATC